MNGPNDTQTAYADWLRRTHAPAHARRTAGQNAAFFLSHLRPGMTLLDAGCGPGSITLGLAAAVAPGEATGIDATADVIASARSLAAESGAANVRFMEADVNALPFPDATFDAAFSHALLQHLADPLVAVRELRRVVRPGGVIGVADADYDGSLMHPSIPGVEAAMSLMRRLREGNTSPTVGRRVRELLHDAGCADVVATVVGGCEGDPARTAMTADFQARYITAEPFVARVVSLGLATARELDDMADAWREWGAHAGAFWARFWCQAVGRVPG